MKIKIQLERKEAKDIIGEAILKSVFGQIGNFRVSEVEWSTYGTRIEVEITDEPEEVAPATAA